MHISHEPPAALRHTIINVIEREGLRNENNDIWGRLRFPFIADHEYYEKHGLYDFPNVDPAANKFGLDMIEAVKDPEAKEIIRKMIKTQMVEPYKKIVETK
jgi:hypothetical protein